MTCSLPNNTSRSEPHSPNSVSDRRWPISDLQYQRISHDKAIARYNNYAIAAIRSAPLTGRSGFLAKKHVVHRKTRRVNCRDASFQPRRPPENPKPLYILLWGSSPQDCGTEFCQKKKLVDSSLDHQAFAKRFGTRYAMHSGIACLVP